MLFKIVDKFRVVKNQISQPTVMSNHSGLILLFCRENIEKMI